MLVVLTIFNIRYTLLSSHIGKGWNLFPLFRGYLQLRTNLNLCLSMVILEYIVSPNYSNVQSTGTPKGTMTNFFLDIFDIYFRPQYISIVITNHENSGNRHNLSIQNGLNKLNNMRGHYLYHLIYIRGCYNQYDNIL